MTSETEIKAKFWKSLKSDMTMFLGLAEGEDGHGAPGPLDQAQHRL